MAGLTVPWWAAGGWALDLFLEEVTRPHADVDLAVLRRDQAAVQRHLARWTLRWVESRSGGKFHPWDDGEWLELPVPEIHGDNAAGETIEILLNEAHGDRWHFRRDSRIHRPLRLVGHPSRLGIPYLAPEIVLLYKAEHPRSSDEDDFARVIAYLSAAQCSWLAQAIAAGAGDHPWLRAL